MKLDLFTLIFILSLVATNFLHCTRKSTGLYSQIILTGKNKKYRTPAIYSQNIYVLHSVGTFIWWRIGNVQLWLQGKSTSVILLHAVFEKNMHHFFSQLGLLPNDTLHWSARRVLITHLILIELLILLMFQQTTLIVLVLTYWQMIWYVGKKNIIEDNHITSFSCSWEKITLT